MKVSCPTGFRKIGTLAFAIGLSIAAFGAVPAQAQQTEQQVEASMLASAQSSCAQQKNTNYYNTCLRNYLISVQNNLSTRAIALRQQIASTTSPGSQIPKPQLPANWQIGDPAPPIPLVQYLQSTGPQQSNMELEMQAVSSVLQTIPSN